MGRPSLYDEAYCERVIELGRQGMSVVEIACEIGVARATLETNWPAEHPEFLEAFTRAREEAQAWWERAGRVGMLEKSIDSAIFSRSMAARFPKDWREVKGTELSGPDGSPVKVAGIERVIIDPQNPDS
jgi:hypothetical protein